MRPPKVALKEMSIYTPEQVKAIFEAAKVGWPELAVKILLGTGIRVGELCNLLLEDVEDDEDAMFLKIKKGEGGEVPPGAGLAAPAAGDHSLHQPEPAGQHGAPPPL